MDTLFPKIFLKTKKEMTFDFPSNIIFQLRNEILYFISGNSVEFQKIKWYTIYQLLMSFITVNWEVNMAVSYNKLWKLMIDKGLNKTKLRTEAGISSNAMAKLGKNESVQVEVLVKICNHLNCTMNDILEILSDNNEG